MEYFSYMPVRYSKGYCVYCIYFYFVHNIPLRFFAWVAPFGQQLTFTIFDNALETVIIYGSRKVWQETILPYKLQIKIILSLECTRENGKNGKCKKKQANNLKTL